MPCVNAGGYVTVRGWSDVGQASFTRRVNFDRVTGQFQVPDDGLYVIISRLGFLGSGSGVYAQQVTRVDFGDEPVLVDRQFVSVTGGSRGSEPIHSSVAAGVARLRANQRIYVEVAAPAGDRLAAGSGYSTFSIVKLQDG